MKWLRDRAGRGVVVAFVFVGTIAGAVAAPGFARNPTATQRDGGAEIRFAVNEETDVAVSILDSQRKVIRHLAAGMLGANAPAPFKAGSLAQVLEWDGKDDRGKALPKGSYTVRVGLGAEASFDRYIGFARQWLGNIYAMACDGKGLLYAYSSRGLVVLDRQGKVLRQLAPAPGGFPLDKLAGLKPVTLKDGSVHFQRGYAFPGGSVGSMGITPDGYLLMPGPPRYARNLTKIGTDGSVPADAFDTKLTRFSDIGYLHVAASPDGKYAYVAGAEAGYKGDDARIASYRHSVYRLKLGTKGPAENFIGDDENGGIPGYSGRGPKGLACDAKGNLYVCRYRAGDINVYDPAGGRIKGFKIDAPQFVAVHPKTGQVYCLAGKSKGYKRSGYNYPATMAEARLVRFSADGEVELTTKLKDPWVLKRKERAGPSYRLSFAMDFSGKRPLIWVGVANPNATWCEWNLLRIEDRGEAFGEPREVMAKPGQALTGGALLLLYDRKHDVIYHHIANKLRRYTGEGEELPFVKFEDPKDGKRIYLCEAALDPDGNICVLGHRQWQYGKDRILKFTPEGKLIPLPDAPDGVSISHPNRGADPHQARGFTVAPNGDMYAMYYDDKYPGKQDLEPWDRSFPLRIAVAHVSATGKMLNPRLIAHLRAGAGGIRVDGRGNIFVGDNIMPPGVAYPWDFVGVLPDPLQQPYVGRRGSGGGLDPLLRNMGMLLKFGPKGGTIVGLPATDEIPRGKRSPGDLHKPAPEEQWFLFRNQRLRVTGAEWQYHGFAPVPAQYHGVTHVEQCTCLSGRFDLDEFGRAFVPDSIRRRITVLDSAGNVILRFGRPGNLDSNGEDPAFAAPWWVAASSDRVFVSDRALWRITRVQIAPKVKAECGIDI